MLVFIVIFCVIVALGFSLAAAWTDWGGLVIPNIYPAGILLSFVLAYAATFFLAPEAEYFESVKSHALSFGFIFVVTFLLFTFRMIGAGDSKMLSAVAIWTGFKGMLALLFWMGIAGGVLALFALYVKKRTPFASVKEGSWIDRVQKGESAVPYGIAIAVGAVTAFYQVGYFSPESLQMLAHAGG
jgi:prepilin peptidase CpaA